MLACHSASATSLFRLRETFPETPFVGLEPAVKPAAEATHTGVIGVLSTQVTAEGELYRRVVERYASHIRVITRPAPELVLLVERGQSTDRTHMRPSHAHWKPSTRRARTNWSSPARTFRFSSRFCASTRWPRWWTPHRA